MAFHDQALAAFLSLLALPNINGNGNVDPLNANGDPFIDFGAQTVSDYVGLPVAGEDPMAFQVAPPPMVDQAIQPVSAAAFPADEFLSIDVGGTLAHPVTMQAFHPPQPVPVVLVASSTSTSEHVVQFPTSEFTPPEPFAAYADGPYTALPFFSFGDPSTNMGTGSNDPLRFGADEESMNHLSSMFEVSSFSQTEHPDTLATLPPLSASTLTSSLPPSSELEPTVATDGVFEGGCTPPVLSLPEPLLPHSNPPGNLGSQTWHCDDCPVFAATSSRAKFDSSPSTSSSDNREVPANHAHVEHSATPLSLSSPGSFQTYPIQQAHGGLLIHQLLQYTPSTSDIAPLHLSLSAPSPTAALLTSSIPTHELGAPMTEPAVSKLNIVFPLLPSRAYREARKEVVLRLAIHSHTTPSSSTSTRSAPPVTLHHLLTSLLIWANQPLSKSQYTALVGRLKSAYVRRMKKSYFERWVAASGDHDGDAVDPDSWERWKRVEPMRRVDCLGGRVWFRGLVKLDVSHDVDSGDGGSWLLVLGSKSSGTAVRQHRGS